MTARSPDWPSDWPEPGPIDLDLHDLPHASSTTEWWYLNAHLATADGRNLSLFASFFRLVKGRDEVTKQLEYAHSLTWAISDADGNRYLAESRVDRSAPQLGLDKVERGEGSRDPRLRRAMKEVLLKGKVPYPDQMFEGEVTVSTRKLELDYDGARLLKDDAGRYELHLFSRHHRAGADLVFRPEKPPQRHGDEGVVKGVEGEDMFYYFIPRCAVTGRVVLDGRAVEVASGSGWYDHEFGGFKREEDAEKERGDVAWNWCALQLDDGTEVTAYSLVEVSRRRPLGSKVLLIDSEGHRREYGEPRFQPIREWRSKRSFNDYPTSWQLDHVEAGLKLLIEASFDDQEFITVISKPAFWEGRVTVAGSVAGRPVTGLGYVERSGFVTIDGLDDFFPAVGKEVRRSVRSLIPFHPTYEQVRDLIASPERDDQMEGVDIEQFVDVMIRPVREITDRGGKSWRSYAALACCDVVGGDSREFVRWLAMPELMHVGSLIVDDVQDRSTVRRGGPPCHEIYGDGLAINAGTACYFMGQKLLRGPTLSQRDQLRLYDFYFGALRAGHAGQAFDLGGLDRVVAKAVETGESGPVERRVLAIHRLKTAVPAGNLARMGAVAGGGTEAQIEGLGRFFEAVGLAFQIIDDVLNLKGFKGDLKSRGEDVSHGKVTLPVAKALGRLPREQRRWLWNTLRSKPTERGVVDQVISVLDECGALEACEAEAHSLVEEAWVRLDPLVEDSLPKLMLRAFGWYVLERHY